MPVQQGVTDRYDRSGESAEDGVVALAATEAGLARVDAPLSQELLLKILVRLESIDQSLQLLLSQLEI